MKNTKILQPLFDIINKIHCDTSLALSFRALSSELDTKGSDVMVWKQMYWYVGPPLNPLYGDMTDKLDVDDLNEDKLDRWVAELNEIYDGEMGSQEAAEDDAAGEESLEDIARHENHVIDSQEDRTI